MEPHVVYCSACDRNVEVIVKSPVGEPDADRILAPVGICLDYCVSRCTGSMCPLFRVPPAEMLSKLRQSPRRARAGAGTESGGASESRSV